MKVESVAVFQPNQPGPGPGFHTWGRIEYFTVRTSTSETLEIPLDAKLDEKQLCYYVPTPDSEGNDVKMAFKVRVVFQPVQCKTTLTWKAILTLLPSESGVEPY
jgi:hypothetical protein